MKYRLSIYVFLLFSAIVTVKAQCIIPIQIEQNPPLSVVAQTVIASLPAEGMTLGSDMIVDGGDGIYQYLWTDEKGTAIGSSATLAVNSIGNYFLLVTDGNQCSVSVEFSVKSAVGINDSEMDGLSMMYKDGIIYIETADNIEQIRIINNAGQLIKKMGNIGKSGKINLNVGSINKGIYLIGCAYTDGKEMVKRMIIK